MRDAAIDMIKGACMLYIVGYWHLFNYTTAFPEYTNPGTTRLTVSILGLFTLVSGYLMGKKEMALTKRNVMAFYRSRLLRIYPPFFMAMLLFLAMGAMSTSTFIKGATLVGMFNGPPPPTLWFITMIMCFYAAAPVLISLRAQFLQYSVTVGTVLIFLWAGLMLTHGVDARIFMYFPAFALGVFLGRTPFQRTSANMAFVAMLLIGSCLLSVSDSGPVEQSILSMPLATLGALSLFLIGTSPRLAARIPRAFERLSYASFSCIYSIDQFFQSCVESTSRYRHHCKWPI